MEWATKRKIIYAFAAITLTLAFVVYETRSILFPVPTCFDNKKNGYETNIDCGGTCALRCIDEVSLVSVDFATAIKVAPNTYDLVAMLSNKNISSAPTSMSYVFIVLNKNGKTIASLPGDTLVPVDSSFPIVKQEVTLSDLPTKVLVKLVQSPYYKTIEKPRTPLIRTTDYRYEPGQISRLYVSVINTTRNVYLKLPVRLVLYDEKDNVIATGESIVPSLDKEETKDVVFTWHGLLSAIPTKMRAYPILSPFGSAQ